MFHFTGTFTAPQLQYFQQNGILHFKNFVSRDTVRRFIRETENVQQQLIRYGIKKVNGVPLKYGTNEHGRPFIQRIAFASQYSQVLSHFFER